MLNKFSLKNYQNAIRSLKSRGVPQSLLSRSSEVFSLDGKCLTVSYEGEFYRHRKIPKASQLHYLQELVDFPFDQKAPFIIYGRPDDDMAKMLALYVMCIAFSFQFQAKDHSLDDFSPPLWHTMGRTPSRALRSQSREREAEAASYFAPPSMLVLTNIVDGGPNTEYARIAQIRDLVEHNPEASKILVVTGNQDPLTFCMEHLHLTMSGCVLLSSFHKETL